MGWKRVVCALIVGALAMPVAVHAAEADVEMSVDPFTPPRMEPSIGIVEYASLPDLDDLVLQGVVQGKQRSRVLLADGNGEVLIVGKGDAVSRNGARVIAIGDETVTIFEPLPVPRTVTRALRP